MLIWQGEVGRQVYTDTGEGGDATWKLGGRSGEFKHPLESSRRLMKSKRDA